MSFIARNVPVAWYQAQGVSGRGGEGGVMIAAPPPLGGVYITEIYAYMPSGLWTAFAHRKHLREIAPSERIRIGYAACLKWIEI